MGGERMARTTPYTISSRILGVILLAAAGMKFYGLSPAITPSGESTIISSPRLQVVAIEAELLLGLWLLSGLAARKCWAVALGFFGLLAGVSLYQALTGQRDCGCFGRVAVSPWLTFVLDLAAATALLAWRPRAIAENPKTVRFVP